MEPYLIKDIHSIKKLLEDIENFEKAKQAMPLLKPVLKLFGVDTKKLDDPLSKITELKKQVDEFSLIPDRFDDLFGERGWIIYESMNLEVAKEAIRIAQVDNINKAETYLVNHYNFETVRSHLIRMNAIEAFRPRMTLAQKALLDYEEERYHACIPVVLALLDGLVNELHEKQRGFFAQNTNLTAWDSISAHSKGLNALSNLFQKSRKKTRTEKITVPYRHGIMHGRDLGYDNQIVAVKVWAALFATREWAIKAERGLLDAQEEKPKPSLHDIIQQLQDNETLKKETERWKPRNIVVGVDIPKSAQQNAYAKDTPERKLAEYLDYWKQENYGFMAKCLASNFGLSIYPSQVRNTFKSKKLKFYEFAELNDIAPSITEIKTTLVLIKNNEEIKKQHKFRMLNLDKKGRATVRKQTGNNWTIINWEVN